MSIVAIDPAQYYAYINDAKSEGHGIIVGGPDCLQLDLDSDEDRTRAVNRILSYWDNIGITKVFETESKSGNTHFHCLLKEPMARKDRIFWQCALGSDGVRELLHWIRFREGMELEAFLVVPSGQKMTEIFDFTEKKVL